MAEGQTVIDTVERRFAQTVVGYSLGLHEGDVLVARTTTLAVPLLAEVYREAIRAGAHVVTRLGFDGEEALFFEHARGQQLDWVSPVARAELEAMTARLTIQAPYNTREGADIDPARTMRHARAHAELSDRFSQRSAARDIRWCGTLYPTHALAQEAGMSFADYQAFVWRGMFLDHADPAGSWIAFSAEQQKKVDVLDRVRTVRIVAEDTDLTLDVGGRKWMNSDGKRNFPSGEVFTGPVESSANGHIRFTFPAVRGGREVEGVRLRFEAGQVVEATAARGADYLRAALDTDSGARYLGEVAIGNNYGIQRFTKNTLFDEKIGGTCHLALGASYRETGGTNKSAIHWDMICDLRPGGEILADGQVIHRDGKWIV